MELIEHLECLKEELHKLIAISEEGAVAHNDSLRHDVKIARELVPELEKIIQLHIDSNKSMELEEKVGEDEFSKRERRKFAEICPDINLETGLKYCMDSKSFLIQMFTTYTDDKRAEKIQAAFDSGDWKNYQILVHALKSTSLSIGAESLSEQAKAFELAAKENKIEEIREGHGDLMAAYQKVRAEIKKWLEAST